MSSIGAVKAALVSLLSAALPDTQVLPGPVSVTTLGPRVLEVGGESTPIVFAASNLTGTSGTELYTLTLTASVSLAGTNLDSAEDLAVADFAAAVVAIQADPSLGIGVNATCEGAGELVESANASGRAAAVRFPVEVFATL